MKSRRRPHLRRRPPAGFSLLEVIAALVILSIGAAAAFTWLTQSVATLARLRTEERAQLARLEVLDYLRAINPAARPEGAVQMADFSFSWTSRPLREAVSALNALRAPGIHEVSLFEVSAHVSLSTKQPEAGFDITLPVAGFRQTGKAQEGPAFLPGTRP
jgi:general secretion pathway protein I